MARKYGLTAAKRTLKKEKQHTQVKPEQFYMHTTISKFEIVKNIFMLCKKCILCSLTKAAFI